jgi:hypothetical protein
MVPLEWALPAGTCFASVLSVAVERSLVGLSHMSQPDWVELTRVPDRCAR